MMLQLLIPTVSYLLYFPVFCIGSVINVLCSISGVTYSLAVHISNEYCWIMMSGSYVLSSDCIGAFESCITLRGIHGEWMDTEENFLQVSSVFSVCSWIHHFSMLTYHCTLWWVAALTRQHIITALCGSTDQAAHYHCTGWQHWPGSTLSLHCVAALTRQHIITSWSINLWPSLADDTSLFTHCSFLFLIYTHFAPENLYEHFNALSFLHNHDEAPVTSHWHAP
jgi:hypothetical protein